MATPTTDHRDEYLGGKPASWHHGTSMAGNTRSNPRVSADILVKVRTTDGRELLAGQIRNISLGGVFIETSEPQPFGKDLDLEFSIPGAARRTIRCKAFVVWSTKTSPEKSRDMQGMGLRLTDIGVQDMRALAEFIGQQLGT